MVRRVLNLVYREVRGLHQAAYVLALFAFGSQILALVRDRLLANEFGAGAALDMYYAAFRIPDLLYVLFASTLSVYVLIPFVARHQKAGQPAAAQALLSQIFTLFLILYAGIALVLFVLTPTIVPVLFPGITDQALLTTLVRILLLQPLFLGISSLFGVVTQLGHRFVLYAISPLIYNVGIIFGIVFLYPLLGLSGLTIGVVLGALGHMAIQWPLVRQSDLAFSFMRRINWDEVGAVLRTSIPRALTLSLNQLVLLVLVGFASVMAAGSVSVFQFAYNLQSVPLAVIGASYSVAAFPLLAELHAAKNFQLFTAHITTALRHILFWSVPAVVLVIVLRAQIVRVVLGTGAFDWGDTRLTAAVLAVLIVALASHAINLLMIRALYAGGNTLKPLLVSLISAGVALAMSYGFVLFYNTNDALRVTVTEIMRVPDVIGSEVLALAFGYTVSVSLQSLLLLIVTAHHFKIDFTWLPAHIGRALIASLFGGVAAYAALNFLVAGLNQETFVGIFLQGLLSGVFGVVGVILGYAALRSPELTEVTASFQKKLFKTDVVAPQKDVL